MDTMRDRFAPVLTQILDEDPRVAVVLAEIGAAPFSGAARRHPERVINVGIREQLLVGAGAGLALAGMRPVMHTFASFLVERPFEQVKLDFGHQGVGGVLVSAGASYDVSSGGFTHMAPGDVALLDTLDGWRVHVPGHPDEAEVLLRRAVGAGGDAVSDSREYVRLSVQSNREALPVDGERFLSVREGRQGVVVAVGPMLDNVLAATEGLDVSVLYATTIRPFDDAGLRQAVDASGSADVVIVEPYLAGTSTRAANDALADVPHRVLGLGVGRRELRRYGSVEEHVAGHGLDARTLRERISGFLLSRDSSAAAPGSSAAAPGASSATPGSSAAAPLSSAAAPA
ncbi:MULTISPECIES: transketolase family protein [unclassified Streptomyces]|uniref:transketolase family protein n=1 Tax=unclassified Streptomyces TaxID=2593676 RepID=UPI002E17AA48